MKKKEIEVGDIIEITCKEHGTHIGEVEARNEDRVLISPDFVGGISDIKNIIKKREKSKTLRFI